MLATIVLNWLETPEGYIIKDTGKASIDVVPNIHGTYFLGLSKAT
jgi:hypothetical protein